MISLNKQEVEKMNNITKKLQKLVHTRKTSVVVFEQKKYNQYSKRGRSSTGFDEYYSSSDT
jgi:hypothetical protein